MTEHQIVGSGLVGSPGKNEGSGMRIKYEDMRANGGPVTDSTILGQRDQPEVSRLADPTAPWNVRGYGDKVVPKGNNLISVLDHGFVKLRNIAGPTRRVDQAFDASDVDVANAARLSFEGMDQARTYEVEMKLNRYLLAHKHMTPFEVIVVWLEVKLPIFVARQLVRQRTQTINEASARYIKLPPEWYIPDVVGGKPVGGAKQGQSDTLSPTVQARFKRRLHDACARDYEAYEESIADGVAPEHARMFLHVNHYTHWMTTMNLRNLLISFLVLRDHSHAQIESQAYAQTTISLIEPHLPGIMKLYNDILKDLS